MLHSLEMHGLETNLQPVEGSRVLIRGPPPARVLVRQDHVHAVKHALGLDGFAGSGVLKLCQRQASLRNQIPLKRVSIKVSALLLTSHGQIRHSILHQLGGSSRRRRGHKSCMLLLSSAVPCQNLNPKMSQVAVRTRLSPCDRNLQVQTLSLGFAQASHMY